MKRRFCLAMALLSCVGTSFAEELTENPIPPPPQIDVPPKPRRAKSPAAPKPTSAPTPRPTPRAETTVAPPDVLAREAVPLAEAPIVVDQTAREAPNLDAGQGWVWFLGAFALLAFVIFFFT